MENKEMTIREALETTKAILDGISVPVALMEQIGAPLKAAADNLAIIIEGIKNAETAEGEEEHGESDQL